jgi:SAM-dependent methyltransferase
MVDLAQADAHDSAAAHVEGVCGANQRPWNSPTTLYIARRLRDLAGERGGQLAVLDMGCGDGTILEQLTGDGHDLHGYDLPAVVEAAKRRLQPFLGDDMDGRIRAAGDERTIPFPDSTFDVVYANQVFEHVRFLDTMLAECARVLKPGGTVLALFPLATYPIEWHLKIPFAHWIPPGKARIHYLRLFYASGVRPRLGGSSAMSTAVSQDEFLRERTYYRFMNEIMSVGRHYFGTCTVETGQVIRAKLDLLALSPSPTRRTIARLLRRAEGPLLDYLVTHFFNAALCLRDPRKDS